MIMKPNFKTYNGAENDAGKHRSKELKFSATTFIASNQGGKAKSHHAATLVNYTII